jgi:pimeloyl-ACP methyl ester carboxylesterase
MLAEGEEIKALANTRPLTMPVLAVGAGGGPFTAATMTPVTSGEVRSVLLERVGHYPAMDAPEELAQALLEFFRGIDGI